MTRQEKVDWLRKAISGEGLSFPPDLSKLSDDELRRLAALQDMTDKGAKDYLLTSDDITFLEQIKVKSHGQQI
ncbi:MAG TPA: hypothetical protein VGM30_14940 [Puia sp.]|jgi:hypothetical protein